QFGVTLNPHEITPAAALVGAITGANTTVADQKPGSVTTAGYMDVSFSNLTFNPGSEPFPSPAATTAPAPAGALLASLGGALLLAGRLVRRRFAA
ncbi:MAG TPA: hypothetical protein VFA26_04920, partial [Gemmataceae bacterium]|nr:hypothetical protein [Gemmataceae bacterium]